MIPIANFSHPVSERPSTPPMQGLPAPSCFPNDIIRLVGLGQDRLYSLEYITPDRQFASPNQFLQHLLIDVGMRNHLLDQLRTHVRPQGERIFVYHTALGIGNPLRIIPPLEDGNLRSVINRMLRVLPSSPAPDQADHPPPDPLPFPLFMALLSLPSVKFDTPGHCFESPVQFFKFLREDSSRCHKFLKDVHNAAGDSSEPVLVTHLALALPLQFHPPLTDEVFTEFLEDAERLYKRDGILLQHVKAPKYCSVHNSCSFSSPACR